MIAATLAGIAEQNAWLSGVAAVVFGIGVISIYYYLASRYPGLTLIGITKKIFGKYVGFAVCVGYIILFLTVASHIPWYITGLCKRVMCETPTYILSIVFMVGVVVALLYGIETIARSSELFLIIVSLLFGFTVILLLNNMRFDYMLPVLEKGIAPVFKGSVFLSCYITFPVIMILMVIPGLKDISKAYGAILKGFLWSGAISTIVVTLCILVLGSNMTSILSYPMLTLVQEIKAGAALTRLEYVVSVVWRITQLYVDISFFYSGAVGLSELFGLKDHKKIILPLALILLIMSGVVFPSTIYQMHWVNYTYTPWSVTFGIIIPFIMVLVYIIKKYMFKRV